MAGFEIETNFIGSSISFTWKEYSEADGYYVFASDEFGIYNIVAEVKDTKYFMNLAMAMNHYGLIIAPYIECEDEKHVISQSKKVEIPKFKREFMNVRSLISYHGVTLSWIDEKTTKGCYFVLRKVSNAYEIISYVEESQITLQDVEGHTFLIASIITDKDGNLKVDRISEEYVYQNCKEAYMASEKIAVSVVIPVYNNEKYVARCIDSVLLSTLKELEVILVDDGSKDKSSEILDWYQKQYPEKVIVIHQKNSGVSAARNAGIEKAEGTYIAFVDSDDFVNSKMYEMLYNEAHALNCDVAICQYFRYSQKNGRILRYNLPCKTHQSYDTNEFLRRIYSEGFGTVAIWHKIYKTSLVKERRIPEMLNEDTAWTPYIMSYANRFCFVSRPLYCWDRRVECSKVTLSNELSAENPTDKYDIRVAAFEFFLQKGNQNKLDCLSYCAVKRVIQCAVKYPKNGGENPYYTYIKELQSRYNLLGNSFLQDDAEYSEKVKAILSVE